MNTYKYKVGEKVRVRKDLQAGETYGNSTNHVYAMSSNQKFAGTIVTITKQVYPTDSSFENNYYVAETNELLWHADMFEPISKPNNETKIVIINNGLETIATKYDDQHKVASASTKCNPDDKYDFEVGAKLALERLCTNIKKV